jgi:SAM-dependent methyltransferase
MIASSRIPDAYRAWNKRWGAPFGFNVEMSLDPRWRFVDDDPSRYGPFGFQHKSMSRMYDHPWAYHIAGLRPGLRVIDLGGRLSGFQVTLADAGCEVFTVDPSAPEDVRLAAEPSHGATTAREQHARFLSLFGAEGTLVERPLPDAGLEPGTFDRIFAIAVLEDLDDQEVGEVVDAMRRLLAPGGRALLSIGLFLDLPPFGRLERTYWGTSIDVCSLVKHSGMEMVHGNPAELYGFPDFDPQRVIAGIDSYHLSVLYPVLSQQLVLRKTGGR